MAQLKSVHFIIVLDESGSMREVSSDTSGSLKACVEKQKEDAKQGGYELFFSLVKFNSAITYVHSRKPIEEVKNLPDFSPSGYTALYQAIGETIEKNSSEKSNVVFAIITDGVENSSDRKYSRKYVFDLIEEKTKAGWQFLFVGAQQSEFSQEDKNLGLRNGVYTNFGNCGVGHALQSVGASVSGYAHSGQMLPIKNYVSSAPPASQSPAYDTFEMSMTTTKDAWNRLPKRG